MRSHTYTNTPKIHHAHQVRKYLNILLEFLSQDFGVFLKFLQMYLRNCSMSRSLLVRFQPLPVFPRKGSRSLLPLATQSQVPRKGTLTKLVPQALCWFFTLDSDKAPSIMHISSWGHQYLSLYICRGSARPWVRYNDGWDISLPSRCLQANNTDRTN
jgi:hypothetical protein